MSVPISAITTSSEQLTRRARRRSRHAGALVARGPAAEIGVELSRGQELVHGFLVSHILAHVDPGTLTSTAIAG
jgi:hypothetical protein